MWMGCFLLWRFGCAWVNKEIEIMKNNQIMSDFVRKQTGDYLMKMNLQYFAEGGDGTGEGDGQTGDNEPDEKQIVFKSQSELDAWYDKKAAKTFERWEKAQAAKLAEAEKKGKMSAAEQAAYDLEQEKAKLKEDRQALQRDKDEATTIKRLAADKLPDALSGVLAPLYGGEEETLNNAYEMVVQAFRDGVEAAVNDRLAQSAGTPAGNAGGSKTKTVGERFAESANARTKTKADPWSK